MASRIWLETFFLHVRGSIEELCIDITQINALAHQDMITDVTRHVPARIHATGTVSETDEGNDTFMVTVWQQIFGVPLLTPLRIRAMIWLPDSFLWTFQPLPPLESTITFTGNLLTVKNSTALIAMDNHSYFVEVESNKFQTTTSVHDHSYFVEDENDKFETMT